MIRHLRWASLLATLPLWATAGHAAPVDLTGATIVPDTAGTGDTLRIAATMLAGDIASLGPRRPVVAADLGDCTRLCIVIGRHDAPMIARLARAGKIDLSMLAGGWERHVRATVRIGRQRYLLIAGSDRRGAVYGVTDLSRALGISPWTWWADVTPRRRAQVAIDDATFVSQTPSVRYRGIFLNDEDWGLLPWAAKTLDPATGNIGPKTYARVFQLMWRLKANTVWPAMHSVSTPFYGNPGNPPLADAYGIVIGTSHAEPMLRNNLREWDEQARGPFDFTGNGQQMTAYWRERVAESKRYETVYTVGLRGIHDGPMQGATDTAGRRAILEKVVGLQRGLLADGLSKPASQVPQTYVAYHELQEAYDAGLTLPDDVTVMWTDDNYGYLRRLSTPAERRRSGGAGVYYHLSYWGRPHDYLWLGTTHPALIREQMGRAWTTDARRSWIVNVGDIKPIEYLTQYFLDLAFDAALLDRDPAAHLTAFMTEQFGASDAAEMASIMMSYYDLAWDRKPEFMGFGQAEWVTPNRRSDYAASDGEEAQQRLSAYAALVARAEAVAARLPADRRDAYFELVLYPVRGAAKLNERILKRDLAGLYADQGRAGANAYVDQARAAHAVIVADTARYNALAGGKWRGMMDMAPRDLPVFREPRWPYWSPAAGRRCDLARWGQWLEEGNSLTVLQGRPATRSLTLFAGQPKPADWRLDGAMPGFTMSQANGRLTQANGYEQRLTLRYDGHGTGGTLKLACGGGTIAVPIIAVPAVSGALVEQDRSVLIPAAGADTGSDWKRIDGLGSQHSSLRARLDLPARSADGIARAEPATYRFTTTTAGSAVLETVALPTHPVMPGGGVRIALRIDDGPLQTLDFATIGRSDAWRRNMLANTATRSLILPTLAAGPHRIRIWPLDPGVMLDRLRVTLDGARPAYGALPAP